MFLLKCKMSFCFGCRTIPFVTALGIFLLIWANGIYADLSGKGEILPEAGFIRVQGRVISLQGIRVIAYKALCKDKKSGMGLWQNCMGGIWGKISHCTDTLYDFC